MRNCLENHQQYLHERLLPTPSHSVSSLPDYHFILIISVRLREEAFHTDHEVYILYQAVKFEYLTSSSPVGILP